METFRPIAMRCTQSQFEEIKPKLRGLMIENISPFYECGYLINNVRGKEKLIGNVRCSYLSREVHEEWNERIFLEACGITPETLQERLANLENELKEVKALIEEENKPKISDICKFWDDDKSIFIVGKLERVAKTLTYPYRVCDNERFKNCEKITDPTLLESLNGLFKY